MRTINKILPYTLTNNQVFYLKEAWIINWIWGQWQNIEKTILDIIKGFYNYDDTKANDLLEDIRAIANIHDISYSFKLGFYKSNFLFAYRLFKLLHWEKLYSRIGIMTFTFFLLNKYWKKYY